jgi:hypothetical protein
MIEEFLKTRTGVILLSVVWGLGLATLFKRSCNEPGCKVVEYHGPPLSDTKLIWQQGTESCYRIQPYPSSCSGT